MFLQPQAWPWVFSHRTTLYMAYSILRLIPSAHGPGRYYQGNIIGEAD